MISCCLNFRFSPEGVNYLRHQECSHHCPLRNLLLPQVCNKVQKNAAGPTRLPETPSWWPDLTLAPRVWLIKSGWRTSWKFDEDPRRQRKQFPRSYVTFKCALPRVSVERQKQGAKQQVSSINIWTVPRQDVNLSNVILSLLCES